MPCGLFALISVLVLAFLLVRDLLDKSGDLSTLLSLHLSLAKTFLDGSRLYLDYFDFSPPLVFEFAKLPYLLQSALGSWLPLRIESITKVLVVLGMLGSSLLSAVIMVSARRQLIERLNFNLPRQERLRFSRLQSALTAMTVPYLAALWYFACFVRLQVGELQFLYALALAPFLLITWLASEGLNFSPWLRFLLGLSLGVVSCFDFPFLPISVVLILVGIFSSRSLLQGLLSLFTFQNAGFLFALLLGGLHYLGLPDEVRHAFEHWVYPMKVMSYQTFDQAMGPFGNSPEQQLHYYLAALALLAAAALMRVQPILAYLALVCLAGLAINLLEKQGFSRDLLLADFGSVAVLTVSAYFLLSRLPLLFQRRVTTFGKLSAYSLQIVLLAAGISLSLFLLKRADLAYAEGLNPHPVLHRSDSSDINIAVGENSKWKEPVFILCDYPDPAYPLLFNLERPPGAYLVNGRPMRLLQALLRLGPLTGDYLEFYEHIKDSLRFSFEQRRPQLVFVHGTDAMEFLTAAGLRPPLEAEYDRIDDVIFLTDNVAPREFLGFYIDFAQFKRKPNGK
ncbi:MAG: hypothetical protein SFV17_07630 [Candidatus Obscuribacter sp.]|nr:hypothetical protein [Candidatus Obscuribacter sp.]